MVDNLSQAHLEVLGFRFLRPILAMDVGSLLLLEEQLQQP